MSKYLCLTFDDGPNLPGDNTMNDMLDILQKHGVPASFFLIGNKISEENKKVILRAVELGCDIENHSWSHPFMGQMTAEQIKEEYTKCDDLITSITGVRPSFFRPPYINVSDTMYQNIKVPFICGRGCNDWEPDKDAGYRYQHMKEATEPGVLYLLHVTEGNKATLEAVDRLVPELQAQGYEFVNLPDLFKKCGVDPHQDHALWTIANNQKEGNVWGN